MEEIHREVIQRNIIALSKGVNLDNLYPLLVQENLIQDDDIREFKAKFPDPEAQAGDFFLWYRTRGPKAFDALIKSLRALELENLATLLESGSENASGSPVGPSRPRSNGVQKDDEPLEFHDIRSAIRDVEATNSSGNKFEYVDIHVETAKVYNMGHTEHAYQMMSKPRGYALIINNIRFGNKAFPYREGAEVDSVNLERLLEKLGFEVTLCHDLGRDEFLKTLEDFKLKFSRKCVDACFVSIMSHGHENLIEMCDERTSTVHVWHDVITKFNNVNCRALLGKPKIFLVQSCRGEDHDYGISRTQTDCGNQANGEQKNPSSNSKSAELQIPQNISNKPAFADILLCYATIPGYVANRDVITGSWYTRTLCEVFMKNAHNTEIKKLLDMVGRKMEGIRSEKGTIQTPSYVSIGFNYDLYFNPGLYGDNSRLPARHKPSQETASSSHPQLP